MLGLKMSQDKSVIVDIESSSRESDDGQPISTFTKWFRSPLFNVIIVGLVSFTQPGIWNALNSKPHESDSMICMVDNRQALVLEVNSFHISSMAQTL